MSSRKQRLDVGSSSSSAETSKPRKRRFDDVSETDYFNNSNKSKDSNNMSQSNEMSNSNINRFTMQTYSHQYYELYKNVDNYLFGNIKMHLWQHFKKIK